MTHNLFANVFSDPSSTDEAYLSGFDVTPTPGQPLLIFGTHFAPADTAGRGVLAFRPLPVDPGLTPTGTPELPRPNYRDDPATINASIGSSANLTFGVNGPSVVPSGLPARAEQSSTLTFNPSDFAGTVAGRIGLDGATSFWYANTAVIDTGSVWLNYGDLSLTYDAARAVDGDSGWVFTNNMLFASPVYDVQDFVISNVVPATATTSGSFQVTGQLYTTPEFRDGFGIKANLLVGSFTLNGVTAVPEPSGFLPLATGSLAVLLRRSRHNLARRSRA